MQCSPKIVEFAGRHVSRHGELHALGRSDTDRCDGSIDAPACLSSSDDCNLQFLHSPFVLVVNFQQCKSYLVVRRLLSSSCNLGSLRSLVFRHQLGGCLNVIVQM